MEPQHVSRSDFDLLVVGAGSGGIACAKRAAQHGARCALVALGPIGGTCVHAGCIPKKLNWEAAHAMEAARLIGCLRAGAELDLGRLKRTRDAEIHRLQGIYERSLHEAGIAVVRGRAVIEGEGRVKVLSPDGSGTVVASLTGRHVLVATGSEPIMPPSTRIPGVEHCISSDDVWALTQLPQSMCIIGELEHLFRPSSSGGVSCCVKLASHVLLSQCGYCLTLPSVFLAGGGYIGVETASTFRCFGSDVFLVVREDINGDGILRGFDGSLRESVEQSLRAAGVHVRLNFGDLKRVEAQEGPEAEAKSDSARDRRSAGGGDGPKATTATLRGGAGSHETSSSADRGDESGAVTAGSSAGEHPSSSGRQHRLFVLGSSGTRLGPFDTVLLALGRKPRTAGLGLDRLGVALQAGSGAVVVDDASHSLSHGSWLHAVGDVTGHKQLTPVAIAAGRLLADCLFGCFPSARMDYTGVPTALFAHPPLGTVGLTQGEAEARFGTEAVVSFERRFTPLAQALSTLCGSAVAGDHHDHLKALVKLVCRRLSDSEAAADALARQQCQERLTCDSFNALCGSAAIAPLTDSGSASAGGSEPGGSCVDALQAVAARLCCPSSGSGTSGRPCGDVACDSHGLLPGLEPLGSALEAALRERGRGQREARAAGKSVESAALPAQAGAAPELRPTQSASVRTSESRLHDSLLEPSRLRVIGLHVHGPDAHEMVQGLALAVKLGLSKAELDSVVAVHPTVAEEAVTMAPWMPAQGYSACESICGCSGDSPAATETQRDAVGAAYQGKREDHVAGAAAGGAGRPGPRVRSSS